MQVVDPSVQGVDAVSKKANVGRLFMVDLAGSERLKKSQSVGPSQSCPPVLCTCPLPGRCCCQSRNVAASSRSSVRSRQHMALRSCGLGAAHMLHDVVCQPLR